jgi:hypothetical protein
MARECVQSVICKTPRLVSELLGIHDYQDGMVG